MATRMQWASRTLCSVLVLYPMPTQEIAQARVQNKGFLHIMIILSKLIIRYRAWQLRRMERQYRRLRRQVFYDKKRGKYV